MKTRKNKNRNRMAALRLTPPGYPNPILIGGIVLGVIAGILLLLFVVSPLFSAGCSLADQFWARLRSAIGPL